LILVVSKGANAVVQDLNIFVEPAANVLLRILIVLKHNFADIGNSHQKLNFLLLCGQVLQVIAVNHWALFFRSNGQVDTFKLSNVGLALVDDGFSALVQSFGDSS
jgi:hypothetical protein